MNSRPAVFLDRDGVLNPNVQYPHVGRDAVLFDDVVPALQKIESAGFILLVVTNQSGVARRMFTLADVSHFNEVLSEKLQAAGVHIAKEDFYVCHHGPDDFCECRKPKPGLLLRAAVERNVDLVRSVFVGDNESDVEAGQQAGTYTILLDRGSHNPKTNADAVVSSLTDAAKLLIQQLARPMHH